MKTYLERMVYVMYKYKMASETSTFFTEDYTWDFVGRVKWFNRRAGFGFITVVSEEKRGVDIFVHHTSVNVTNEQYRYLIQGEYVSFTLETTDDDTHPTRAVNVRGVYGAPLMCETQYAMRQESEQRGGSNSGSGPRARGRGRGRQNGQRRNTRRSQRSVQQEVSDEISSRTVEFTREITDETSS